MSRPRCLFPGCRNVARIINVTGDHKPTTLALCKTHLRRAQHLGAKLGQQTSFAPSEPPRYTPTTTDKGTSAQD